jgi:hypothetical protein
VLIGTFVLLVSHAAAADNSIAEGALFETVARYMPDTDAEGLGGSVGITEAQAEYRYTAKVGGVLPVTYGIANSYVSIENSSPVELPSRLVALKTDIETTFPFLSLPDTYLRVGVGPSFFGDSWSFSTSDFRLLSRAVLIHKPNEAWVFVAGLAFYPDYETEVFPVFGFIYTPSDKLSVNITPRAPKVSYVVDDQTTIFLEAGSSGAEYEVRKGDLKSAVLKYTNVRVGTGVTYRLSQTLCASFSCGGVFNRTFKYRDSLGKVNLKDGAYIEARLSASF